MSRGRGLGVLEMQRMPEVFHGHAGAFLEPASQRNPSFYHQRDMSAATSSTTLNRLGLRVIRKTRIADGSEAF
jgi:hypothetical protein